MLHSSVEIRVRYEETDQMGVVYHANYFSWFEVARVELLDAIGYPYAKLEKDGFMLPVISCEAKFIMPARFDDRLYVQIEIKDMPVASIKAHYRVFNSDLLLATGMTKHAFVATSGKVVRPPKSFLEKTAKFFS